jgi:trans-aconitate 2-methyltransferase
VDRQPEYTFRDHDLAAQRLTLVAETFAPLTTAFVHEAAPAKPNVAIDLGCGLGHSTRILMDVAEPRQTIGLDSSERFLAVARATTTSDVEFVVHDITELPLPGAPAELIFCRFLLVHLADPEEHAQRWSSQLAPRGHLLLQETEAIESAHPIIRRYLEMVDGLLRSRGADLYVGKRLARAPDAAVSRPTTFHVPIPLAARMFVMNIESWHDDTFIAKTYAHQEVDELMAALQDLATSDKAEVVDWTFREMSLRHSV